MTHKQPNHPKLSLMEKCEVSLREKLSSLKEEAILLHSLSPKSEGSDFEILEFYGDSVLYERISQFYMKTRRFMNPGLLTKLRAATVCNATLAKCYDRLDFNEFVSEQTKPSAVKEKGDVIEAVIGEMAEALIKPELATQHAKITGILNDLMMFISFQGEQYYHQKETEESGNTSPTRHSSPPKAPIPKRNPSPTKNQPKRMGSPPIIKTPGKIRATTPSPKRVTFATPLVQEPVHNNSNQQAARAPRPATSHKSHNGSSHPNRTLWTPNAPVSNPTPIAMPSADPFPNPFLSVPYTLDVTTLVNPIQSDTPIDPLLSTVPMNRTWEQLLAWSAK